MAVYLHTPFCPSKCGYCDFNSYAMTGPIQERTVAAIVREVLGSPHRGRPAKTIFFGGGTPTFLEAGQLERLLDAVRTVHPPVEGCEITSEANPGTVDIPKFAAMRRAGFNRISLGAQSFEDGDLVRLDRVHRGGEIERAVGAACEAGFGNLNLDLMFALPGQSRHAWNRNLDRALALAPEHLSLYCLTIEPNTAFYRKHLRGELDLPDDEAQVAMYDDCHARLAAQGYAHYEISNFSKPGRECAHNLAYWRGEEYAGYGPGAVGCMAGEDGVWVRSTNLKHPERYCAAVEAGEALGCEAESLDDRTRRTERLMLGLRLAEGVSASLAEASAVERLVRRGWLDTDGETLRLTEAGRHFCSEATLELLG